MKGIRHSEDMMRGNINYPFTFMILLLFLTACGVPAETAVEATATVVITTPTSPNQIEAPTDTPFPTPFPASKYEDLEIITLLPRDAIPAIDEPQFLTVAEADAVYDPDEFVIGVEFNGEARAYSVPLLSNHEIVNDTVGGVKIAVTW
jgi:hypothetical protein